MVYPKQLTLQMRHKQLLSINPDPTFGFSVYYAGVNPMSLSAIPGTISNPWFDATDFCEGLDKFSLSWSTTQTATGEVPVGQFLPKKGVSGNLIFETEAMQFIKAHLVEDVAATLNEIEVQITDTTTGVYTGYVIKANDLSWCEFNSLCVFDLSLRQADPITACIERTLIADNWQGWFQDQPAAGKKHPRFSYCVERRPNGVLIAEWILISFVATLLSIIYLVVYPIFLVIYGIVTVINSIITAINTIPGISIPIVPNPLPPTPGAIFNDFANMMIEAAGCGREHPAPLIRDYISNVCDKCGISYDASTIDIFFAPFLTITHSDGLSATNPNPHYNACLFYPTVERGIRRFQDGNTINPNTTTYYQQSNQPVWALSDMLDALKKEYNARWQIRNIIDPRTHQPTPTLFFKRKDWFVNEPPLYDFSLGGIDRPKIIEGICYQQSDYQVPASCNGLYEDDPSDKCGHEAAHNYNGDPLSFNNTMVDPHFFGILDKHSGFAAAKFNLDGSTTNYLYDALQWCWSLSGLSAGIVTPILTDTGNFIARYADYALLLQTETVTKPKILIWDGKDTTTPGNPYLNARCVRDTMIIAGVTYTVGHTGVSGTVGGISAPDPNPLYPYQKPAGPVIVATLAVPTTITATPPDNYWDHAQNVNIFVQGKVFGGPAPAGVYEVVDYFGIVRLTNPAILVNWPAYFNPYFKGSMWDLFHWIDSPYRNPQLHKTWHLEIPLCKADLEKLGLLGDATDIKLLASVVLDTKFYNNGVVTGISVDYNTGENNGTGATIELKGYV